MVPRTCPIGRKISNAPSSLSLPICLVLGTLAAAPHAVAYAEPAAAATKEGGISPEWEFQRDFNWLVDLHLGKEGSVERVYAAMQQWKVRWLPAHPEYYNRLVLEACRRVRYAKAETDTSEPPLQRFVFLALHDTDSLQIYVQAEIVRFLLDTGNPTLTTSSLTRSRRETARLALATWTKIEKAYIPDYNSGSSENFTYLNVAPYTFAPRISTPPAGKAEPVPTSEVRKKSPLGGLFFSGMSPDYVTDPTMRAAYIEAIEENSRRRKRNYLQRQLKQMRPPFSEGLDNYLIAAYSQLPDATTELQTLMDGSLVDEARKARIVKYATQAIHRQEKFPDGPH